MESIIDPALPSPVHVRVQPRSWRVKLVKLLLACSNLSPPMASLCFVTSSTTAPAFRIQSVSSPFVSPQRPILRQLIAPKVPLKRSFRTIISASSANVVSDGVAPIEQRNEVSKAMTLAALAFLQQPKIRYEDGLPTLSVPGYSRRLFIPWKLIAILALLLWALRRMVVVRHLRKRYVRKDLYADIANFYDIRSAAWESVWGEHMHHGLYDTVNGKKLRGREAQVHTMYELLHLAETHGASILPGMEKKGPSILDVGCGIGGASRYLATKYGQNASVHGVTLSPYQRDRGNEINESRGFSKSNVLLHRHNAYDLNTKFEAESFDLVWSLESAEHMDNKQQFVSQCTNMLRPGAPFVMLAWCIREVDKPLSISEQFAIRKIMEEYCLPSLASPSEYSTEMVRAGLVDVHVEDWTDRAAPFWNEVLISAMFNPKGIQALFKYGWPLLRSALAARHVVKGIQLGVFRLVAFTGRKPTIPEAKKLKEQAIIC